MMVRRAPRIASIWFSAEKRCHDDLQVTRRLVEEVAIGTDGVEGVELSFHDIEKA